MSMKEFSHQTTLSDYLHQRYAVKRTLQPGSLYQYVVSVRAIDSWSGDPVTIGELSDDLVNRWLMHLERSGLAPATVKNRRTHVLSLWHSVHRDGLCKDRARDIRAAKVPYNPPSAWTYSEVQKLLEVAEGLRGFYPSDRWQLPQDQRYGRQRDAIKIPRRVFWGLLIRLAWDTGLRQGDLFSLRSIDFDNDGLGEIVQRKTRRWHQIKVSPETLDYVRSSYPPKREFILVWHASKELMRRQFEGLARAAGIRGSIKKIRKSAATDVEIRFPGCGAAFLGHAREMGIAGKHYLDPRLLIQTRPMPRPLSLWDNRPAATNRDMALTHYLVNFFDSEGFRNRPEMFTTPARRFGERLGREPLLSDLTPQNLDAFNIWLRSTGNTQATARRYIQGLRAVWTHAFAHGLSEQVPPSRRCSPTKEGAA